ncbi:MAG: hypothetical protein M1165_00265 [Candidatus Pacearchaeota archaeon]|nr:hypothetical protein [Candidatus Pacearchaeota archaeon]MDE1848735.1 hypothetical protein [Nanoarchaeota archaeon]
MAESYIEYTLFVNDRVASEKEVLDAFFASSKFPGVVIPTVGFSDAVLKYKDPQGRDMEIQGAKNILMYITSVEAGRPMQGLAREIGLPPRRRAPY